MEEQYPLWLLLHLFLNLSAENGYEDVPIWGYFGFSHALRLLSAVFRYSFPLWIISDPLSLQAANTDALFKNRQQLPSAAISLAGFLRMRPWHHQQTEQQQNCQSEQDLMKFYIRKWLVDNVRTKTMVKPCQKNLRHVFMFSLYQYKKSAPGMVQHCRLRMD